MNVLRFLVERLSAALVIPLRTLYAVHLASFATVSQCLSLIPGFAGVFIRRAWYQATLARCGDAPTVAFGAMFHDPLAEIGDNCFVGKYSIVGWVRIGDDFLCGDHVQLLSGMRHHPFDRRDVPIRAQGHPRRSLIEIGSDVWVGAGAIVGSDVAAHCIVAAGSVVLKPVEPEWIIVGGVPAKLIAERP